MKRSGIVLCGGRSSRMGRPKALLPWRGRTLVETVVATLRSVVDDVVVVSSGAFDLPRLEARVVLDREAGLGPLAGIREGLDAIGSGLAFAASADAPYLSPRLVESLLSYDGAAALELDGRVQTLGAVYDAAHAEAAEELIASGRMRPLFLLEASGYHRVKSDRVLDADSIRRFNWPQDYLAALRSDEAPGGFVELVGQARYRAGRSRIPVPIGTLGEALKHAESEVRAELGSTHSGRHLVSLNGRDFVSDPEIPIGTGDRVIVMDRCAGG